MSLLFMLVAPLVSFAAATGFALAVGVDGLGPAASFGSLAFAVALVLVLLRDPAPPRR
jgi:hypothetical protein